MRTFIGLATLAAACSIALAAPSLAAPPDGKGKPAQAGHGNGNGNGSGNGSGNGKSGNSGGNPGNGNGGTKGSRGGDDINVSVSLATAGISIAAARGYAADYGLTGYSALPPGIRKNLARGKPLPPGIAKKMVPGPMLARLPVHPGYEWRVAGSDLILVAIGTAIVADVLFDVFD